MRWVCGVVAGGVAGVVWDGPPWMSLSVAVAAVAVVAPVRVRLGLLVMALTCVVAARGSVMRQAHLQSALRRAVVPAEGRPSAGVAVSGRLRDDATVEDGAVRCAIDVDRVEIGGVWRAVSGRADVSIGGTQGAGRAAAWTRGRRFTAVVQWRDVTVWRDPGAGAEWWQRLTRDAVVVGHVKSAALVDVEAGAWWSDLQASLRRAIRRGATTTAGQFAPGSAAVVTAILIGDRSGLDDKTTRRLQAAGTYHLIAISGGNVAVLVVAVLLVLQPWRRHPRGCALVAIVVVLVYGSLVIAAASVLRAVIAATLALGLMVLGLRAPPVRIWAATAGIIAVCDPLRLIDVGTWLSFAATGGILAWAPQWYARWRPQGKAWRPIVAVCAATAAAEVAIAPVTAIAFGQISVAGLVLNPVAIPAMAVVELAGLAAVVTAGWAPAIAMGCGAIAHVGVEVLLRSAGLVDLAPWLVWTTPPQPVGWTVGYYAAVIALGAGVAWAPRVRLALWATAAIAAAVIVASPVWFADRPAKGWLRVTFLDVGQGDAILVDLPSGRGLLVDAGGASPGFDVGARVVQPALWALGRRRLDWLALTHGDGDHAGGIPRVLAMFRPREFWDGVPVPADPRGVARRAAAEAAGAAWRQVQAGDRLEDGPVTIDVWHPPRAEWERPVVRNDDSVVLRLTLGDVAILLTGDAGREVEAGWPALGGRLRVVQVPHHGSKTSSSTALLRGTAPHLAVISVGRGNTFGHPASEVLAAYQAAGADVVRTDRDGAITLETDGRRIRLRTWTGRRWEATVVHVGVEQGPK